MTATTAPKFAAIAATKTNDELHLAIYAQYDVVKHGDIGLLTDNEVKNSHAIYQAAMDELHTRALAEYTAGGTESPKARRDRTRRTAPACEISTLNQDTEDREDGYTRRVALDELQARARKINDDRDDFLTQTGERTLGQILTGDDMITGEGAVYITERAIRTELHQRAITARAHDAHLVSEKAATRYLADLIDKSGMDGEDVSDMGHDEHDGLDVNQVYGCGDVYRFLVAACDRFDLSGYTLLQSATETVLGW
jgi:hypothetical protein